MERFRQAHEALAHADHDVEAGRKFVAAYVAFTHYAEQLRIAAARGSAHEAHAAPAAEEHHHQ